MHAASGYEQRKSIDGVFHCYPKSSWKVKFSFIDSTRDALIFDMSSSLVSHCHCRATELLLIVWLIFIDFFIERLSLSSQILERQSPCLLMFNFSLFFFQFNSCNNENESINSEMPGFAHLTNNKNFFLLHEDLFLLGVCMLTYSFVVSITIFYRFFLPSSS